MKARRQSIQKNPTAAVLPVEASDGWLIDFSGWRQGDKRKFAMAVKHAAEVSYDESELYPAMAQVVKGWPFELDPSKVESYDQLPIEGWEEALDRVQAAFRDRHREIERGDVPGV